MTAAAKDRDTARRANDQHSDPVAAATKIYAGTIVQLDASGNAVPGSATAAQKIRGVAQEQVDNTDGAAGDLYVPTRRGVFRFANSASTDLIARDDIGKNCYVVDDSTVALTDDTAARPLAGVIRDVDSAGVWVEI